MRIIITSWNCQGGSAAKLAASRGSILTDNNNILLLQEVGSLEERYILRENSQIIGRTKYKTYYAEQENVKNKRCTTGVLVADNIATTYAVKFSSVRLDDVKRPFVYCILSVNGKLLYISTIHATANHRVSPDEIARICEYWKQVCKGTQNEWILMGDMNADSEELPSELQSYIIAPDEPTQKSGGTLDYVLASKIIQDYFVAYDNKIIRVDSAYRDSDHLAIQIAVDI
ncbi:MAG: endonuclease/exonuclease/phosphatase family protein [Lachnospiraceae bacterium]|nr:endonuclease/exonuclease/phosphatase family protein [Lachnospiraceae bacterium]